MGAVQDDSAWEAARAAHCDAFVAARAADDVDGMAAAALVDDLDRARQVTEAAYALGTDIGIPDAFAVYHEQRAEIARHADDIGFLASEAGLAEDYGVRHGIESVIAEAAVLALQAGDTERASRLVLQVAGGGFGQVPYEVDWLLTVSKTTEAAAGLGCTDIARAGMTLMAPYAGRCVVNADLMAA